MSPRTRVFAIVATAAVVVAGATVGVTLLQTRGESTGTTARKGFPPLDLPASPAVRLYQAGKHAQAEALFSRSHDLGDEIGAAFARWPHGTLDDMEKLVAANPESGLAQLHLGLAAYWSGRDADAATAWTDAAKVQPDEPSAITALDFLHPGVAPGLPPIVVDEREIDPHARALLLKGIESWDREHVVTAKREIDAAAKRAPRDPVVLTADAVATFTPASPERPFPKLGPLTAEFPKAAVVRLHLGVLLLWTRQVKKGEQQLRLAVAAQPGSVYASQAKVLLNALSKDGTH
ncbi:MAG: hypothetical protein JOY72_11950 [Actinobacteria bacterium]|nr:hypothetical protein [Actinomycetota bacterium]MBV8599906.1 hypothetical protein [Actinomycetota bacterium]